MKNVCANSKIDSILKFVCVMLTYQNAHVVDFLKTEICGQKCDFEHSVIGTE